MFAPGIVAIGVAAIVLLFMKESPESQGFKPVNAPKELKKDEKREPLHPACMSAWVYMTDYQFSSLYVWQ